MERSETKGYIFDVDGTLYSQFKVRLSMCVKLLFYYLPRINRINELLAIYYFRKYHEESIYKNESMSSLYSIVSKKVKLCEKQVERVIDKWMFYIPLNYIKKFMYKDIKIFIDKKYKEGCKIIIYSDYPAEKKIDAIGIKYTDMFISGNAGTIEKKPSKTSMKYITDSVKIPIDNLIYIGDREEKDGFSARLLEITYYDVKQFRRQLKKAIIV